MADSAMVLPSMVIALVTVRSLGCPAIRLLTLAAAPWSTDSSGCHRSRTRTSRTVNTRAAIVTMATGVRLARCRDALADIRASCPRRRGSHGLARREPRVSAARDEWRPVLREPGWMPRAYLAGRQWPGA